MNCHPTSGLLLARFLFTLPKAEKEDRLPGLMVVPMVALAATALALPWSLYAAVTGKAPYGTIDFLALGVSAWPLGLAAVLVIAALGIGLRAPSLPEGDLLGSVARFNARAVAAAQAAASVGGSDKPVETARTWPEIWDGLERLERLINDHAASSVTLILIALGLFAALA